MKYFFIPLLLIAAVAVITYLISISVKNSHAKNEASQILWYGRNREYYIYEMLASAFQRKNVLRNLKLPIRYGDQTYYTDTDVVTVTHAGVVVIEVLALKGKIDNPASDEWCQRYRDKIMPFKNPYKQNETHVKAVENMLRREGILNVPVYNVVVFSDNDVRFSNNYKWLFKANEIVDFIARLNDRFTLSKKDMRNVVTVLSPYTVKRKDITGNEKNKQKRHQNTANANTRNRQNDNSRTRQGAGR